MAVITFPTTLYVSAMSWGQRRNELVSRSVFGAQTTEIAAPLWIVTCQIDRLTDAEAGEWKSLMMRLQGQVNQLALWDHMRPVPIGTMRGTMTLSGSHAAGATSLVIDAGAGQAATTLKQGDLLGIGSGVTQQVVMVTADATANGSGVITTTIQPPLRNAFSTAAAVTWDKPTALFRRTSSDAIWDYASVYASGFSLDLIEDWRP